MILTISSVYTKGKKRSVPGPKDIENTSEKMNILAIPAIPVEVLE
jgi:hypothetical protein